MNSRMQGKAISFAEVVCGEMSEGLQNHKSRSRGSFLGNSSRRSRVLDSFPNFATGNVENPCNDMNSGQQ